MIDKSYIITFIIVLVLIFGLDFIITAGILFLICWCFQITFTWKLAFGIWLIILLLAGLFKSRVKIEK